MNSIQDGSGSKRASSALSPVEDVYSNESSAPPRTIGAALSRGPAKFLGLIADRVVNGAPAREAARLAMRLVAARGMSVVTLVVAAWLVNIEAFAEFGVYQTLATLAWIALFLRYDAAIVAARTEAEAGDALRLCLGVGAVLWLVFAGLAVAGGGLGLMRMELALLLPFSILARGMLRLSFATATRNGDFKGLGRASVAQTLLQPLALVLLVLSPVEDALCFALADILGHASGVVYLLWRHRHRLAPLGHGWSVASLTGAARHWKSQPLYNLPSSFFALAFVTSPLLIVPMVADAVFAGHVALAYRMFDVPTQIVTAASTPIFLNRLRPSAEQANPVFGRHIMLGLMLLVGLGYALMAGLLMLADPLLEHSALSGLSEAVPYVALFQLFVALAAPLNDSCALYPQQKRLVLIQGMALMSSLLVAVFATVASPASALLVLAGVSALRTLALGELLRTLSSLSRRAFYAGSLGTAPMQAKPASGRLDPRLQAAGNVSTEKTQDRTSLPMRASMCAATDFDNPSRS